MFKFNFKVLSVTALSILTLATCFTPSKALTDEGKNLIIGGTTVFSTALIVTGACLINHFCIDKGFKQIPIQKIDIQSMSDEEAQAYLNEQIIKFESTGDKKTFVIDKDVKEKSNPRILALVIKGFNEIFAQYPMLAKYLTKINTKSRHSLIKNSFNPDGKFRIQFLEKSASNYGQTVAQCLMADGVAFNEIFMSDTLQSVINLAQDQVRKGAHSKLNPETLIEAAVAHEVGHIIEFLICSEGKNAVIKLAKIKNPKLTDTKISNIGEINESEWFAEVFAHSIYGEVQNDLSLAIRQHLYKEFKNI